MSISLSLKFSLISFCITIFYTTSKCLHALKNHSSFQQNKPAYFIIVIFH